MSLSLSLSNSLLYAEVGRRGQVFNVHDDPPPFSLLKMEQIRIPKEFGSIQEYYQAPAGSPAVILIQDAHAIPDAQRNIQKLIDQFQKQYGLNHIALEGASSELDLQIFRSFPDKDLLKKTFEDYSQKGELTGVTASAIFNERGSVYRGIEDWKLYEEGLGFYLEASQKTPPLLEKLSFLEKELETKKQSNYSKDLLEVDRALGAFHKNQNNLIDILKLLAKVKKPEKGTELAILLEETETGEANQTPVEVEVKDIAKKIETALKSSQPSVRISKNFKAFQERLQEFQTSRISAQAFALFLEELAGELEIPLEASNQLSHLIKNQQRMKDI